MSNKKFILLICSLLFGLFGFISGIVFISIFDIKAIGEEAEGFWDPDLEFIGFALFENDQFVLGIRYLAINKDPDISQENNSGRFIVTWTILPFRRTYVSN